MFVVYIQVLPRRWTRGTAEKHENFKHVTLLAGFESNPGFPEYQAGAIITWPYGANIKFHSWSFRSSDILGESAVHFFCFVIGCIIPQSRSLAPIPLISRKSEQLAQQQMDLDLYSCNVLSKRMWVVRLLLWNNCLLLNLLIASYKLTLSWIAMNYYWTEAW